jgi:mono/diheme cytochrome c family protein
MRHRTRVLSGPAIGVAVATLTLASAVAGGQGRGASASQTPAPQGPGGAPAAPTPATAPSQGPAGTPAAPPPATATPQGRGVAPVDRPGPNDKMVVDAAQADQGRTVWTAECVNCHGADARGGNGGPNLVRSTLVLHDRYGSGLGPFLKEGHPMQSGKPSSTLSEAQIVQLSHFLRQRLTDTLRGSPNFDVKDILTGDPKSGAAYFNGDGKCATCHSVTGDLAGIGTRLTPVNIQQRFIFPVAGGRGRGAPSAGQNSRTAITVTVTPPGGQAITGTRIEQDDFFVTLSDASGAIRTIRRTPGTTVVVNNPLQFHIDLLERITDKEMHDVVAYLETLK